eukprot:SAG11_NODE_28367_length_322_cov_1.147982_1_plen_82_part_10
MERDGVVQCELGPGSCFGELALLSGNPRAASVVAKSEGVRLLTVQRTPFCRALTEMPALSEDRILEGWRCAAVHLRSVLLIF